jgi:hypothetical protein
MVTVQVSIGDNIYLFGVNAVPEQVLEQFGQELSKSWVYDDAGVILNYVSIAVHHPLFRVKV